MPLLAWQFRFRVIAFVLTLVQAWCQVCTGLTY